MLRLSDNNDALEKTAWSGFFKRTVSGLITDENFEDRIIPLDDGFKMELSLNAYVQPVVGQRDPSYYVDASLESDMLKHGDELKLSVRTSKDSYIYVYVFTYPCILSLFVRGAWPCLESM